MNVCELTLVVSPPTGQEQVPQDEAHGCCYDEFVRGLGRHLPVNFGVAGSLSPYDVIIYFLQNSYYIVKM
jgi:hypothetical protein